MTIASKLMFGFALPLVILAGVSGLAWWITGHLVETSQAVAHTYQVKAQIEELMSKVKDAETGQRGYLLMDDDAYLTPYTEAVEQWKGKFAALQTLVDDNKAQLRRLDELKPLLTQKFEELAETIRLHKQKEKTADGKDAALALVRSGKGRELMVQARRIADEMDREEQKLLQERDDRAKTFVLLTRYALGGAAVLAVLLVGVFGYLITRSITVPVRGGIQRITSASTEILASTTQQAAGAEEQAAAVAQMVSTVTEVSQTAEQAAQRARSVGDAVQKSRQIGDAGRRVVEDSIGALDAVQGQIESTAENILALAEQSQAIGDLIAKVNDVAEQTNLLALNAAIEAARAGEQGKGFAVVAGEVKDLAGKSREATVQVRQILGEIQKATNAAVLSTETVTKGVAAAAKVATQAGVTIQALTETLTETAQAAAQIVASSGQQAAGMGQVQQAMTNIEQAARQNLAAVRQAEQAAQDLNKLAVQFNVLIGQTR